MRKLLALAVIATLVGGASSCSIGTHPPGVAPSILDVIKQVTATTCNAIPMAETIAAIVAAGFPQVAGAANITSVVAAEIAKVFCQQVTTATASGKLGGALSATVNDKAVELHGFTVKDGKLVEF